MAAVASSAERYWGQHVVSDHADISTRTLETYLYEGIALFMVNLYRNNCISWNIRSKASLYHFCIEESTYIFLVCRVSDTTNVEPARLSSKIRVASAAECGCLRKVNWRCGNRGVSGWCY